MTVIIVIFLLLGAGALMILSAGKRGKGNKCGDVVSVVKVQKAVPFSARHEYTEDNPCAELPAPYDPLYDDIDMPDPMDELSDPDVDEERKHDIMERLSALGYSFAGYDGDAHDEGITGQRTPMTGDGSKALGKDNLR